MKKIRTEDKRTSVVFKYEFSNVVDKPSALTFIAKVYFAGLIKSPVIKLSDHSERNMYGNDSDQITEIASVEAFLENYLGKNIDYVVISGENLGCPVTIGVNLEILVVSLVCRKNEMIDYKTFEKELAKLENEDNAT